MDRRTILTEGMQVLALKIQESMMQSDVRKWLQDSLNDYSRASGWAHYCYYVDHDGDGESGNVVYSCDGDIRLSPYEIGSIASKAPQASIDFENSKNVCPITTYVPEAEDSDHYTAMGESFRTEKLYLALPLYERFISKSTRKSASADSFAGKGRSFPILKAEDVSAALHSIGRAGPDNYSADTLRSNIKRIAKSKGFTLPDSLKDDPKESAAVPRETRSSGFVPDGVLLRESARFQELPTLEESEKKDYAIKLISPGRGSSGYYSAEVLKKAAESNIFKAGTQMFWNHDTDAEESARPEGDLDRLAAVTTSDGKWMENGKTGPGIYARAKVFSDYSAKVNEKGPHIGLSIRAGGSRDEAATGPDGRKGVITALKNAASVDFVTKAGRGGEVFVEAAIEEGDDMDKDELKKLVESAVKDAIAPLQADNKRLSEALALQSVPEIVNKHLAEIRLPDKAKAKIAEKFASPTVLAMVPMKEGKVDEVELGKLIEAEAVAMRSFLMELGVGGNPSALGVPLTEAERKAAGEAENKELEEGMNELTDIFVGREKKDDEFRTAAREAFRKGRAA